MVKFILICSLFVCSQSVYARETVSDLAGRAQQAALVLKATDSVMNEAFSPIVLDQARCIATFPNVVRAGLIFGGSFGQGLVSCRVENGWSRPAFMTIGSGSFGFQFGVDSTDLVLVFVTDNAVDQVSRTSLKLGTDASVAVGALGPDAGIGADYKLSSDVYVYSRTRGFYAGATLEGWVLAVDEGANYLIYGQQSEASHLLSTQFPITPYVLLPYTDALRELND